MTKTDSLLFSPTDAEAAKTVVKICKLLKIQESIMDQAQNWEYLNSSFEGGRPGLLQFMGSQRVDAT